MGVRYEQINKIVQTSYMGYNGSNRRPKFNVGSNRDAKRSAKLISKMITAPLSLGSNRGRRRKRIELYDEDEASKTSMGEAFLVLIAALAFTFFMLPKIIEVFKDGAILGGIAICACFIVIWWLVFKAFKNANKDEE